MAAKDGEILSEGEGELEALDAFVSKRPPSEGVDHDAGQTMSVPAEAYEFLWGRVPFG